jgi:hypothetical protein
MIEEVTPSGSLSVVAGNGPPAAATYGQPPTGSPLDFLLGSR